MADIDNTEARRSSESRDSGRSSDRRSSDDRGDGRQRRPRSRGPRRRGRRVCSFCADKIERIDYKDVALLSNYVNERGRILPRRRTGTCAKHQRALSVAIKRARHVALLPFSAQHMRSFE